MRLAFLRSVVVAFVAAAVLAPLMATAAESHVWVKNLTHQSVWVTAFTAACKNGSGQIIGAAGATGGCTERHIVHEWCVQPANSATDVSKQGFHDKLTVVHILVTTHPNCGRPIIKDWTLQFPRNSGSQSIKQQYNVIMHTGSGVKSYDVETVP